MKRKELIFYLASITLVLSGLSHFLFVDVLRSIIVVFSDPNITTQMDQVNILLFGTEMTVLSALNGWSLSFGILTTGLGVLNVLIIRADNQFVFVHREILFFNIIITFIQLGNAILNLFYAPIFGMGSALILFIWAFIIRE